MRVHSSPPYLFRGIRPISTPGELRCRVTTCFWAVWHEKIIFEKNHFRPYATEGQGVPAGGIRWCAGAPAGARGGRNRGSGGTPANASGGVSEVPWVPQGACPRVRGAHAGASPWVRGGCPECECTPPPLTYLGAYGPFPPLGN